MPDVPLDDSIVARLASWYTRQDPCWPSPFQDNAYYQAFASPPECSTLTAVKPPAEAVYLALRHQGGTHDEAVLLLAIIRASVDFQMRGWRLDNQRPHYGLYSISEDYLSSKVCASNLLCGAVLELRMLRTGTVDEWFVYRSGGYAQYLDDAELWAQNALAAGYVPPSRPALSAAEFLGGEGTLIYPTENVGPWAPDESAWDTLMRTLGETVPTAGRGARTLAEGFGRIFT